MLIVKIPDKIIKIGGSNLVHFIKSLLSFSFGLFILQTLQNIA